MSKPGWVERRDKMEKVFPELLEACKEMVKRVSYRGMAGDPVCCETVVLFAKQAIEKAETIQN